LHDVPLSDETTGFCIFIVPLTLLIF
jgi:hypothetical protein